MHRNFAQNHFYQNELPIYPCFQLIQYTHRTRTLSNEPNAAASIAHKKGLFYFDDLGFRCYKNNFIISSIKV